MQLPSHVASRYRLSALARKSRKSRMPRLLLGSVAAASALLAGLALLGHWQVEASSAATQRQAPPAAIHRSSDPSVPAASEVLGGRTPEPVGHVEGF
ncbi:hypothetical protein J7E62_01430 [Variovorax paradoxus]|nr:hypothetical protein [Variovorax paradoxus]